MIVMALAHTAGQLAAANQADPDTLSLHQTLREHRSEMGLGMRPSALDMLIGMSLTMSVTLLALGLTGLIAAAGPAAAERDRLLRKLGWLDAAWVGALLVIYARHQLLPPLLFMAVIELALLTYLIVGRPSRA